MKKFNLSDYIGYNHHQSVTIKKEKVKEFIRRLKEYERFTQTGIELKKDLEIVDSKTILKIQLMFTGILLRIDELAGEKLT